MYLQGLQEVLSEAAIAKICGGAKALCNSGLAETLVAHFFGSLEAQLRNEAVPELRRQLSSPDSATDLVPALAGIGEAVELQRQRLRSVWQGVVAAGANGAGGVPCTLDGMLRWHETILAAVLTTESAGIDLRGILRAHYRARIAGYSAKAHSWSGGGREAADSGADSSEDEEDLELRVDAGATPERVMGSEWVASLRVVADSLAAAGMGTLNAQVASEVVCEHLQEKISGVMGGRFGEPMLQLAFQYANAVPLEFIVLTTGSPPGDLCRHREHWRRRLGFRVYNSVAELRIGEMFDIVVDYPDSLPALEDLGTCLSNTSNQQLFVRSFSRAIQARLLHAGAATVDIIQQYVSTIKALRVLDSSGVLLEAVGGIIKEYLKGRQDAIRCVVSMLTGDDSKDGAGGDARETLLEELGRAEGAAESDGEDGETDAAALAAASEWEPDPTDADPMQSSRSRRAYDAISTLVGIYGSKELFIGEYQTMLADKLLSKTDFNTEAEIRTLELLKIRFGEACLHNCEIMLKDLADSKRIGANIKQIAAEAPLGESSAVEAPADIENFSATIISPLFWPPFRDGELKLPVEIERKANTFADRYHSLKAPRKLQFGYQLGTANLEITVNIRSLPNYTEQPFLETHVDFETPPTPWENRNKQRRVIVSKLVIKNNASQSWYVFLNRWLYYFPKETWH